MADAPEQNYSLPDGSSAAISADKTGAALTEIKKQAQYSFQKASCAVNATPSMSLVGPAALPKLKEVTVAGYINGTPTPTLAVLVEGFIIEKYTAYDYILMQRAAKKEAGLKLYLASAFRSMEEQTQLYIERSQPGVAKEKGPAAKPGYSNHQGGISLDIGVGMNVKALLAKQYSATYLWLRTNAGRFGFDQHDLGHNVNGDPLEPWHWTHLSKKLYGAAENEAAYASLVNAGVAGNQAVDASALGVTQLQGQDQYSKLSAISRSATLVTQSRQQLLDSHAEFNILNGGRTNQYVAHATQIETQVSGDLPAMSNSGALVYDYDTGRWGDGKVT